MALLDGAKSILSSLVRIAPVATTFSMTMCHLDQHFLFSSFRSPRTESALPSTMKSYLDGILPFVVSLEFTSYATLAANIWFTRSAWGWYAGGLLLSIVHLFNAPYAWKLLSRLQSEEEDSLDRQGTLRAFLRMNLLRILVTDVPLIVAVIVPLL
ncbi:hypothetical protein EJ08DRAFT_171801 [Tothia fuscella]|uniref:Uncharacterized protein n=1 Tax=Tothia fuscella TaxID=1048955 RepID=A0A9P4U067_9PEZI|nr:hypothetical protein EJ08DRAFT_171801 [Tothia fuscella]